MAVDFQREEYQAHFPEWQLVDRVCDETELDALLPEINAHDKTAENVARNEFYKDRASWFGGCAFTLKGLIGVAYDDEPEIDLGSGLDYMRVNVDGAGVDLQQQMQEVTAQVLRKGRCGLFTTYPERDGDTSVAEQAAGNAVASIHVIDAKRIINWWTETRGAQVILGGVIFTDAIETVEDYEIVHQEAIRELALEDGVFVDRTWVKDDHKEWVVYSEFFPLNGLGQRWTELPFTFVGALNNTHMMDRAPLLSLACLNRDHYRNSADFEEGAWFAGQAQPYVEPGQHGSIDDIEQAKKSGFYIGGRMLVYGKFGFAQADPNTMARQAMIDKLELMKALGARFLQPGTVAKTAQQDAGEQKVQHSVLSLVIANVEDAYRSALRFSAAYMNTPDAAVTLSRAFMEPEVTVEMIDRVVALLDRAAIGFKDALPTLKRAKLIDAEKAEDEYLEEVEQRGGLVRAPDDAGFTD